MDGKRTVSAAEMKKIERVADSRGISYRQMMENAGTAAFEAMRAEWPHAKKIVIFVGKGNNGGDGFVVARLYAGIGAEATVVLCEGEPVTEDAKYNFELLKRMESGEIEGSREGGSGEGECGEDVENDESIQNIENVENIESGAVKILTLGKIEKFRKNGKYRENIEKSGETDSSGAAGDLLKGADLVVDALYGTGFHGELRENGGRAAALINGAAAPVCALDLPSGMNADTGETAAGAVRADLTVAFHCRKHGHGADGAAEQCGKVVVVSIGIEDVL